MVWMEEATGMAKTQEPIKIQVVLDPDLLAATDEYAKEARINRSAFIRDALRRRIKRLQVLAWEEKERRSFEEIPQAEEEAAEWDWERAWPAK